MKIVKNTSDIPTAFLRMLFTRCHNRIAKLEGKRLRAWNFLKVTVRQGSKRHCSGYAYFNTGPITLTLATRGVDSFQVQDSPKFHDDYVRGYSDDTTLPGWHRVDRFLPILKTRKIAWVFCHELMHVYGYEHRQQVDPSDADLDVICKGLPELPEQIPTETKAAARDVVGERHRRMVMRKVAWQAKAKRAENALKKVEREIRTYEARYGPRLEK